MPKRGKKAAKKTVLLSYAAGSLSRATAMKRLGFVWYGQLVDAMQAAGLRVQCSDEAVAKMVAEIEQLMGSIQD